MSVQYFHFIFDELHADRQKRDSCNLKLIFEKRELWAHSLILETTCHLIRECIDNEETISSYKPLEIEIPHSCEFTCYSCILMLLDTLYARKVGTVQNGHENHIENLIGFLKIVDKVKDFLYNTIFNNARKENITISNVTNHRKNKRLNIPKKKLDNKINLKSSTKSVSAKMLVCVECSLQYYKPSDLLSHIMNTRHGNNVCSLCSFRSESTQKFSEHLRKHDNDKPFFCTTCEQRFTNRTLWMQHLPVHSKDAPFVCPHCPKAFKWKHGLNGHLITHTKDKKHLCDECGFSTTHAKTLRAHKLTHSGEVFRCTHVGCAHTSSRKENMNIHMKTHTKEKPFVCEICGLNFTQNKNLQRHSLKHSLKKEKVYMCLHCPFKALRSDNLKAHMQRQHTEKPLKLELCDNFADLLTMPEVEVQDEATSYQNDLTLLADAASSRSRIDDKESISTSGELVALRNFDNLIANPTFSSGDIYELWTCVVQEVDIDSK